MEIVAGRQVNSEQFNAYLSKVEYFSNEFCPKLWTVNFVVLQNIEEGTQISKAAIQVLETFSKNRDQISSTPLKTLTRAQSWNELSQSERLEIHIRNKHFIELMMFLARDHRNEDDSRVAIKRINIESLFRSWQQRDFVKTNEFDFGFMKGS